MIPRTITLRRFYYLMLGLPIYVAVVLFGVDGVVCLVTSAAQSPVCRMSAPTMFALLPLVFGGVQYLLFVGLCLYKGRQATTEDIRRFSYKAPVYFSLWCYVFILMAIIATGGGMKDVRDMSGIAPIISFFCLPFGYFYVMLAHVLARFLKKTGRIIG